jgi:hypothetical protein
MRCLKTLFAKCIPLEIAMRVDVTYQQNVNAHNRGIGVGRGALAIKMLREIDVQPIRG